MELTDTFKFGKHIGVTVENVIEENSGYITWAISEQIIRLSNDAYNLTGIKSMIESTSIKEVLIKLKAGEWGFFESDPENGPGFIYKTKSGKVFGMAANEIDTKTMLALEKRLG